MRKYAILALSAALACGCAKDSENNSFVIEVPTLEIIGDESVYLEPGQEYLEPGIRAVVDGAETAKCQVEGAVGQNPGVYVITYKVSSSRGVSAYRQRKVYVSDPTFQTFWFGRFAQIRDGEEPAFSDMFLTFTRNGNSIEISDLLGGYYAQGRAYGDGYAAPASLLIGPANTDGWADIEGIESGGAVPNWGDCVSSASGKINLKTGALELDALYSGMHFVTSSQQ